MQKFDLKEFPTTTHQEWQEKIIKDLKGKTLESLQKETTDHITIQPHYSKENSVNSATTEFVSEAVKTSYTKNDWYICQEFHCSKPVEANLKMQEALNAGVDSIKISVPNDINFDVLLKEILPEHIEIRFKNATYDLIWNYFQWSKDQNYDSTLFKGTFEVFYHRMDKVDERIELAEKVLEYFPQMSLVNVSGDYFFNQGSNNVQQLAISLSLANELMNEFVNNGIAADKAANLISFSLATGADYFSEIAKFRAFKALWKVILKEYGVADHATHVHGITSTWTQTVLDVNNNMLRGATQALSAILGGCQTVTVTPFDASVRRSNAFSERMARNTQLIIRDEAFAGKVMDVAEGSYFIEQLTSEIAQKAWELFMELEELGGFQVNLKNGKIKAMIESSKAEALAKAKSGETTILGVNKYPNPMENKDAVLKERKKNRIKTGNLSDAIPNDSL